MDDLIQKITDRFNIPEDKAKGIVATVVEFMKDKLPGPVAGQLDRFLPEGEGGQEGQETAGGGLTDQAKGAFGRFTGGD